MCYWLRTLHEPVSLQLLSYTLSNLAAVISYKLAHPVPKAFRVVLECKLCIAQERGAPRVIVDAQGLRSQVVAACPQYGRCGGVGLGVALCPFLEPLSRCGLERIRSLRGS